VLLGADRVIVTDVYPSREQPIPGVTGELVARAARAQGHGRVEYCRDWQAAGALLGDLAPGDVVLTLGAGDVYRLAERLVAEAGDERARAAAARGARAAVPAPAGGRPGAAAQPLGDARPAVRAGALAGRRAGGPALLGADLALLRPGAGRVRGNHQVTSAWVENALRPLRGENLLRLPLDEVARRVAAHPWLAAVTIEKRLPDRLRLVVDERRPAGLLRGAAGLVYLDRDGRPIAPLAGGAGPSDLLLVSLGTASEVDLAGAFRVARSSPPPSPPGRRRSPRSRCSATRDYRLFLGALPFPLLVRRGTLAQRLPALAALMPELARRYARLAFVDLRSERRIVFQPVVERS